MTEFDRLQIAFGKVMDLVMPKYSPYVAVGYNHDDDGAIVVITFKQLGDLALPAEVDGFPVKIKYCPVDDEEQILTGGG